MNTYDIAAIVVTNDPRTKKTSLQKILRRINTDTAYTFEFYYDENLSVLGFYGEHARDDMDPVDLSAKLTDNGDWPIYEYLKTAAKALDKSPASQNATVLPVGYKLYLTKQ